MSFLLEVLMVRQGPQFGRVNTNSLNNRDNSNRSLTIYESIITFVTLYQLALHVVWFQCCKLDVDK